MKENSKTSPSSKRRAKDRTADRVTIGMDLGDKKSQCYVQDSRGNKLEERACATTKEGMAAMFAKRPPCLVVIEVGTHSPWVSRELRKYGHEVIVANARKISLISQSSRKDDKTDARMLAKLARVDRELLRPIRHRSEQAQVDRMAVQVRATLVEARTSLINAARGMAKSLGARLPDCDAGQVNPEKLKALPAALREVFAPLLRQVAALSEQIEECDEQLERMARKRYPRTELLRQVWGVGTLIALTFILTIDDPYRFEKSRDVGCYLGLRPKRSESGERQPELRITKEGDVYLRKLLVQGAHCILSRRAPDSDLKRWGHQLAGRGGKNARKRAVVAVARKLAVLLHHLWVSGEVYEPLRNRGALAQAA